MDLKIINQLFLELSQIATATTHKELAIKKAVIKAIDDEEELPGEMPDEMYAALKECFEAKDKAALAEWLRILVSQTKNSIKDRFWKLLDAEGIE